MIAFSMHWLNHWLSLTVALTSVLSENTWFEALFGHLSDQFYSIIKANGLINDVYPEKAMAVKWISAQL